MEGNPRGAVDESLDGCRFMSTLVSSKAILAVIFFWTVIIHAARRLFFRFTTKVILEATIVVIRFSLLKYRGRLGDNSFRCLIYTTAQQYLVATDNYETLQSWLQSILADFMVTRPNSAYCMGRLQRFALRNCLLVFHYELRYLNSITQARELASWLDRSIIQKKQGRDANLIVKERFAFVLVVPKHGEIGHMYSTLDYLDNAVRRENVRRIYVLAAGRLNMVIARLLDFYILHELGFKEVFAATAGIPGKNGLIGSLVMAYETP